MLRPILGVLGVSLALAVGCAQPEVIEERSDSTSALQDGVVGNLAGKRVLILPFAYASPGETTCFNDNAKALLDWYVTQGVVAGESKVVRIDGPESFIAVLEAEQAAGAKYDRVITMGHGGLDGPIFAGGMQIGLNWPTDIDAFSAASSSSSSSGAVEVEPGPSPDEAEYKAGQATNRAKLVALGAVINAITKPSSFVYLGSCNAGTGKSEIDSAFNFVELTTCISGRAAFGTGTTTSCTDAGKRIKRLEQADVSNMLKEGDPTKLAASAVGLTCVR